MATGPAVSNDCRVANAADGGCSAGSHALQWPDLWGEATMTTRWKNRPTGSNWGDFGPDDQLGRLNLLTPEKVRQGVAEVRDGRAFCLSLPLDYPGGNVLNPRRHPPRLASTRRGGRANYLYAVGEENPEHTDVICDDTVLLTLQYSTQFDALCHVGSMFDADGDGEPEPVFYNGWRGGGPPMLFSRDTRSTKMAATVGPI